VIRGNAGERRAWTTESLEVRMMPNLGIPELAILLVLVGIYLIPGAAAVWALVTLQRIRAKVDTIERLLQRS
jgi:hypothetical protein